MKYCHNYGRKMDLEATICICCGYNFNISSIGVMDKKTIKSITQVFIIVGCIFRCLLIITLLLVLPIILIINNKLKNNEPISLMIKLLTLILVSFIGGIALIC